MADAPDLGSGVLDVGVQVPLSAPDRKIRADITILARILFFENLFCNNPALSVIYL